MGQLPRGHKSAAHSLAYRTLPEPLETRWAVFPLCPHAAPPLLSPFFCPLPALQELLEKCNPLGMFDAIASLAVAQNMRDLYRLVLVDTPLAPYFSDNLTSEDLDEMNIEVGGWVGGRVGEWAGGRVGGWVAQMRACLMP